MATPTLTPEEIERLEARQRAADSGEDPLRLKFDAARFIAGDPERDARNQAEWERREAQHAQQKREDNRTACFAGRARYRRCTLASFETPSEPHRKALRTVQAYVASVDRFIADGASVLFYGPPGTGKDHLMACLIHAAVDAGRTVRWKNGMDLFGEVRDRMDDGGAESSFVSSLVTPDALAISDPIPPFGELSSFQAAMLFRIIDGRYSMGRPTWVTINAGDSVEMEAKIGTQTVDRLTDGAVAIHCNWPSYRRERR